MNSSLATTWQSAPGQTTTTTIADAECLQRIFGGNLDISVYPEGRDEVVYVQPLDMSTAESLANYLARHGAKCCANLVK